MVFKNMLMQELKLDVSEYFDRAWCFCKSFGFKLQPNMDDRLSVVLFTMKLDCSIAETKLHGHDTLLAFFNDPLPYLLVSIHHHKLDVVKVNLYEGEAKQLSDLRFDHNFYVNYQDKSGNKFNLSDLLGGEPHHRVAWAHYVIQGCYDKDREFDTCFEMHDGQLVAASIDYLRMRALEPTKENIEKAIAASSQANLFSS